MRVERLPEYVTTVTVTAAGIAFALYCGTLTGSGQTQMLLMIFAAIASIAVLMFLRSAIWVLIPIVWVIPGVLPSVPFSLGVRDVAVFLVAASFFLLAALKVVRLKPTYSMLDLLVYANVAYLATVFVRNPVGMYLFDSDRVGGRPYFNVAIAFAAYWVLSRAQASPRMAQTLPWMIVGANMIEGFMGVIASKFPGWVPLLSRFYGSPAFADSSPLAPQAAASTYEGSGRNISLMYLGSPVAAALYSKYRPSTLLNPIYFVRFTCYAIAVTLILLSGFRSLVVSAAAGFLIASYFRGGTRAVVRLVGAGIPLLVILVMMQGSVLQLPRAAQRALSFLPGDWDPVAVAEAKHSTDWRLYMWKNVLSSDRYISNKLLGDGFGFSIVEMGILARGNYRLSPEEAQESYMVMGEYHSGPITTIRYVGVVGLLLFTFLLFLLAREGWKLIRTCQGGPYEFISFFIGIPLIYEPFQFFIVYGGFKDNITSSILAVGMVKMLQNSLQKYNPVTGTNPVYLGSRASSARDRVPNLRPHQVCRIPS